MLTVAVVVIGVLVDLLLVVPVQQGLRVRVQRIHAVTAIAANGRMLVVVIVARVLLVQVTKYNGVYAGLLKMQHVIGVKTVNISQESIVYGATMRAVLPSTKIQHVVAPQIVGVLIFQMDIIKLTLHLMQRAEEAVLHQISKLEVVGVGTIVFVNNVGGDHTRAVIHV